MEKEYREFEDEKQTTIIPLAAKDNMELPTRIVKDTGFNKAAKQFGLNRRGYLLVISLTLIIFLLLVILIIVICVGFRGESQVNSKETVKKAWINIPDGEIFEQLIDTEEKKAEFWFKEGQDFLKSRLNKRNSKGNDRLAKNIVMFIGDGMGPSTVTAARWFKEQVTGIPRASLTWEKWPTLSLARTYCVDGMVADSGCSATAYSTGVKSNQWSVGVPGSVMDCQGQMEEIDRQEVTSILRWAQEDGRSTGIVTTDEITGASPTGSYGHVASRRWKDDSKVPEENCDDIAMQLVRGTPGRDINVILGKGRKHFLPKEKGGERKSGDLIDEWKDTRKDDKSAYIENSLKIDNVSDDTGYLLGLFEEEDNLNLTALTRKAIQILSRNPRGFFLFVENQLTDDPAHKNKADDVLKEVLHLEETVDAVDDMLDDDTMLLVTADHTHTLSISGYPARGRDILGKVGEFQPGVAAELQNNFSILNYATGPGRQGGGFPSLYRMGSGRHGGDDVPVYVKGPGSEVFGGNMDQAAIPHLMAYSACLGKGLRHPKCDS